MSVLINFTIFPTDKGVSASPFVARVIKMLEDEKVNYSLNSMSTNIETDTMSEALEIVNKAYEVLAVDCNRIYIVLTMDIQSEKDGRITKKIQSVKNKLKHE